VYFGGETVKSKILGPLIALVLLSAAAANAASATQLLLSTSAQNVGAGSCSGAVTVKQVGAGGVTAVSSSTTTVNLAGNGLGLTLSFFSDSACTHAVSAVTIAANQSSASFYFRSYAATTYTLTASSSGLTSASQSEVIQAATATVLAFDSNPPSSLASGTTISPALDVRIEDRYGNEVNSSAVITIGLASGTGSVSGSTQLNASSGRALFNNVNVIASVTGSFTLQASSTGLTAAKTTAFSMIGTATASSTPSPTPSLIPSASKLQVLSAAQNVAAGSCSAAVTIEQLNAQGSAVATLSDATLSLSGNGLGLTLSFFSDSACSKSITGAVISAGQSQSSFYFKSLAATTYTLSAASTGLTTATQSEVVSAAAANGLAFDSSPPSTIVSGATISPALDVRIEDRYGNEVNSNAQVSLGVASGSGTVSGTTQIAAASGRALFNNVSVAASAAGSFALQASSAGLASAKTASFSVTGVSSPAPVVSATPNPTPTVTPSPSPTSSQIVEASLNGIEQPTPEKNFVLPLSNSLSLSVAQNETTGRVLSVQVKSCEVLAITAPTGVNVSLFHMPKVTTTTPSFSGALIGAHYDPLVPISTTSSQICPTESWIWADIGVAAGTAPGNYSFKIGDLPVSLKVLAFAMPSEATMPMYVGLNTYTTLAAHNLPSSSSVSVQGPLAMTYINQLRAHRIEPQGQMIANPAVNSSGSMNLDNWSTSDASFRETEMTGALAPVCMANPTNVASSWLSTQTLQAWENSSKIESTLAGFWAYITDEPNSTYAAANNYDPGFAGTIARAKLVRANAPNLKTMVTSEPETALLGLIDHFTVVFEYFMQPGHWTDYSEAPGYWIYGACMSHGSCSNGTTGAPTGAPDLMLDQNDVHGRLFPLTAYALGAQAALYYAANYDYGVTNPWTNQYEFGGNGDGNLIYPGALDPASGVSQGGYTFTTDTAVASIRMKAIRQGQFDIEYLNLAKQKGLSTNLSTLVPNQFTWSRNNADYEAMRQAIISAAGL
jgi:hypothetical protein